MGRVAKIGGWEFDIISGKWSFTDEIFKILDLDPNFDLNQLLDSTFYTPESQRKRDAAKRSDRKWNTL